MVFFTEFESLRNVQRRQLWNNWPPVGPSNKIFGQIPVNSVLTTQTILNRKSSFLVVCLFLAIDFAITILATLVRFFGISSWDSPCFSFLHQRFIDLVVTLKLFATSFPAKSSPIALFFFTVHCVHCIRNLNLIQESFDLMIYQGGQREKKRMGQDF